MNPAVQRSVLLFTAPPHGVGPHHQKLWNLLVFPSVFVFYVFGSSSSSWDICVLPVSRPSRVCVVNTSTRSLWILWTFTGSILTWTHSETLLGGWKEKFQKMSRTTWLRLQVWKQRQWCLDKVLYFHTCQFRFTVKFYPLSRLEWCSLSEISIFFSGFSSEVKPLSSQRTGSESLQPAGLRSEGAVWFSTESNLSTGDSEVSSLTFVDLISIKQHLYTIYLI